MKDIIQILFMLVYLFWNFLNSVRDKENVKQSSKGSFHSSYFYSKNITKQIFKIFKFQPVPPKRYHKLTDKIFIDQKKIKLFKNINLILTLKTNNKD